MAELNERHGSLVQQFQPGRIVNQISIDRFSGSYEQPIMNTALSNSSLGNSGFHNPFVQNSHGGLNSSRGDTGVRSSNHSESDIRTKMKLCRDGQQCVVNGCSFSHIVINKPCKFGTHCYRRNKCLFLHDRPATYQQITGDMDKNSGSCHGYSKNGYGRAS